MMELAGGIMIGIGLTIITATFTYQQWHQRGVDLDEPLVEFGSEDEPWTEGRINRWMGND